MQIILLTFLLGPLVVDGSPLGKTICRDCCEVSSRSLDPLHLVFTTSLTFVEMMKQWLRHTVMPALMEEDGW